MTAFIVANKNTGELERKGNYTKDNLSNLVVEDHLIVIESSASISRNYYDGQNIVEKLVMLSTIDAETVDANGIDTVTIDQCEIGSDVLINGIVAGMIDSSSVDITFDTAGYYMIEIRKQNYISKEFTVNAN